MRAKEFIDESTSPKIGREYQHFEDLLIVNGANGGIEALHELSEALHNPNTLDLKWDGGASVFWGRNGNGQFIFVPKNQWNKGQFLSKEELSNEIKNTGRIKKGQSVEEFVENRCALASKYEKIWDIFEQSTPADFRGYLNGDLMFTEIQDLNEDGEYMFTPNKVTYYVKHNGLTGKMNTAHVFTVVHGKLDVFGQLVSGNIKPEQDSIVEQFNHNPKLIVLNTQRPTVKITPIDSKIKQSLEFIENNIDSINEIANFTMPKFTSLKKVMYNYAVAKSKQSLEFSTWLENSNVSENQKVIINGLMSNPSWTIFWNAFEHILNAKNSVLEQIYYTNNTELYNRIGIRASISNNPGGEGMVKALKSGGLGKLINPHFRSAPSNPLFTSDV